MRWAKVNALGRVVEIVTADKEPGREEGFVWREASDTLKVGEPAPGTPDTLDSALPETP
jgi:hypothetical protein